MAYQRRSPGARALHNGILQRRAAMKRALRLYRARAETESTEGHSTAQSIVIGPGGRASLQPVESTSAPRTESSINPTDVGILPSSTDDTPSADIQTAVFGGETGQIALIQTQSSEAAFQPLSSAVQTSREATSHVPSILATHATPRPMVTHSAHVQSLSTPEVVSLVVAPVSGSLPPLLSRHASQSGLPSSTPSTASSSPSSMDPTSTGVDTASVAPPLSQNPPIIVGILMVVLLCLAAIAAFVSWITRSSRRRRKNRLESITVGGGDSDEVMAGMDTRSFDEKDAEEGVGALEPLRASNFPPTRPFYIEPHSGIFTHETYPNDAELHDSFRSPDGAYLPSLPMMKYALYDPPLGDSLAHKVPPQPGPQPPYHSIVHHRLARHKETYASPMHDRNLSGTRGNDSRLSNNDEILARADGAQDPPASQPNDVSPRRGGVAAPPANPNGLSWANALRSNLVSALDVVKQAANDRVLAGASPASRPEEQSTIPPSDKFTPLALRPARKSHGLLPGRRGTQENEGLPFSGLSASKRVKEAGSADHKRDESEDDEEPGPLHMATRSDSRRQTVSIGGLGRFSFEQRMNKNQSQSMSGGFKQEVRHKLAVHSTALSRRRSGMASGSGSSSHSAAGSDLDTTMRKRRPGIA